jgi:hypothetical protein
VPQQGTAASYRVWPDMGYLHFIYYFNECLYDSYYGWSLIAAFPGLLIGSALCSIPRKQCRIDSHSYPRQDKNSPLVMFDRMPLRSFAVRVEYKYVFNILHARFGPEVLFLDLKATTAYRLLNCFET